MLTIGPAIADLTVRYHTEAKSIAAPPDQSVRIKGNRVSFRMFNLDALVDFERQQVTFVDSARKRFAAIPLAEYPSRLKAVQPGMPAAATQMFDPAKVKVQVTVTGKRESIQGLAAEEREVTVSGDATVVMRFWCAKPEAPEMGVLGLWQPLFLDAGAMFPGQQAILEKALPAGMVILGAHEELRAPGGGAAMLEIDQNIAEISTAPLADSVFAVPADYTASSFEELYRGARLR